MAPVYRTFPLDTPSIDRDIDRGTTTPQEVRRLTGTTIDRLLRGGLEAAKGPETPKGYPSEILVGGRDTERIKEGFRDAIKGTGLGDYIGEGGKTYT